MLKKICLSALLAIICPLAIFSQNDIEKYQPPKVIDGSDLTINARSDFSVEETEGVYRTYGLSFSPVLSKFRYSDKLNYIINTGFRGAYSYSYFKDVYDTNTYNASGFRIDLEGGMNYYFLKNILYLGTNGASFNSFSAGYQPLTNNYIGPNIGFGRIVNASEVSRTHFFEQVLKKENIIPGNLPYNIRKKLTELFDKRNNREFIYKFKEDDEIEFFTDVETLLRENGIINTTLDSRTVLKLYQSLVNTKYLVYPKYKGYQMQTLFYFPFGSTEGSKVDLPYELVFSGIYGLPLSVKTQLVFYGFYSKLFNIHDNNYPSSFFASTVRNIFPLSIERYQYDNPESKFFTEYAIGYDSRRTDYYFGGNISVFHNFTDFLGIRGYANLLNYRDKADQDYVLTAVSGDVFLDYGILSRLILSGRFSTYVTTAQRETNYLLNGGVNLSYIVF